MTSIEREAQLYELLIGTGESTKVIAFRMGLNLYTVKTYTTRLLHKMHAASRVDLMHREIERLKAMK
jgi:DNA-binding NarL/FixJ family response regulator